MKPDATAEDIRAATERMLVQMGRDSTIAYFRGNAQAWRTIGNAEVYALMIRELEWLEGQRWAANEHTALARLQSKVYRQRRAYRELEARYRMVVRGISFVLSKAQAAIDEHVRIGTDPTELVDIRNALLDVGKDGPA